MEAQRQQAGRGMSCRSTCEKAHVEKCGTFRRLGAMETAPYCRAAVHTQPPNTPQGHSQHLAPHDTVSKSAAEVVRAGAGWQGVAARVQVTHTHAQRTLPNMHSCVVRCVRSSTRLELVHQTEACSKALPHPFDHAWFCYAFDATRSSLSGESR
eukprot:10175-Chlamydomonas_euryale.AAC.2